MVKLVLETAQDFKRSIDAIAALISEAEFIIDNEALALKATDPSQISMVDFHLPKKAFKTYEAGAKSKIGVNISMLHDVVGRAKSKDSLALEVGSPPQNLKITFSGTSVRSFSIPLLEISSAEIPIPKIDFDAEVELLAEVLQDGLKDASLLSTHVTLGVDDRKFFLKASSTKGTLSNETGKEDKSLLEFRAKKECSAMFPLDYLQNMLKGADSKTPVKVSLKSDAPVRIDYKIADASITYFLAPRIEST